MTEERHVTSTDIVNEDEHAVEANIVDNSATAFSEVERLNRSLKSSNLRFLKNDGHIHEGKENQQNAGLDINDHHRSRPPACSKVKISSLCQKQKAWFQKKSNNASPFKNEFQQNSSHPGKGLTDCRLSVSHLDTVDMMRSRSLISPSTFTIHGTIPNFSTCKSMASKASLCALDQTRRINSAPSSVLHNTPPDNSDEHKVYYEIGGFLYKLISDECTKSAKRPGKETVSMKFEQTVRDRRRKVREHLKRIMRIFVLTWRVSQSMTLWSVSQTRRSAVEMQWHALHTSSEAKRLAFNKLIYNRERNQTRVPRWALKLLSKAPEDRTDTDCRRIHAMLRGLKSFDRFTERIQMAMCRAFSYDCVDSMRVVLRKGHVGINFYFIYSGSVFVNVDDFTVKGEKFTRTAIILIRGDSFGELSLLQDSQRNATVTVREQCELLTVDKRVFSQICPRIFDTELREKVLFLREIPLFSNNHWGLLKLTALCSQAQIQEYKTNKIVTMDSLDDEWIYICMQGKCRIVRHMSMAQVQDKTHEPRSRRSSIFDLGASKRNQTNEDEQDELTKEKSIEKTKSRLLESMNLEYLPHSTIHNMISAVERDSNEAMDANKKTSVNKSITTLTSLMTDQQRKSEFKDYEYIEFAELLPGDVFDLYGIMEYRRKLRSGELLRRDGLVVLVSAGAKMARVKKTMFFKMASQRALDHAFTLAKQVGFPSDSVLEQSYKAKSLWDRYKLCSSNDAMREVCQRKCRPYTTRPCGTMHVNEHQLLQTTSIKTDASIAQHNHRTWTHDLTLKQTSRSLGTLDKNRDEVHEAAPSISIIIDCDDVKGKRHDDNDDIKDDSKLTEYGIRDDLDGLVTANGTRDNDKHAFLPTLWLE